MHLTKRLVGLESWQADTWQFNWCVYHTAGKLLTGSTLIALFLTCEVVVHSQCECTSDVDPWYCVCLQWLWVCVCVCKSLCMGGEVVCRSKDRYWVNETLNKIKIVSLLKKSEVSIRHGLDKKTSSSRFGLKNVTLLGRILNICILAQFFVVDLDYYFFMSLVIRVDKPFAVGCISCSIFFDVKSIVYE